MKLEILLATLSNFKCIVFILSAIILIGSMLYIHDPFTTSKTRKEILKYSLFYWVFAIPIMIAPSLDDLWRTRISLIKLELSSKENLTKTTETIERIGKKLECKYLGCEDMEKYE